MFFFLSPLNLTTISVKCRGIFNPLSNAWLHYGQAINIEIPQ